MWAMEPDQDWKLVRAKNGNAHLFQSETACLLDLSAASKGMPKGTRLACRKVLN